MAGGVVAFTSFTYADLPRALTLARSLRNRHPDWRLYGVFADRASSAHDGWREEFDEVIDAMTLFGDGWRRFIFKHDAGEAAAAVRARALIRLLAQGAAKAVYFAPDIAVFDDLGEIERRLDAASILLTPHHAAPHDTAIADSEALAQRYGVYNLGFLGVRNDAAATELAAWWARRLDGACYDEAEQFNDQKYFDAVPALFDGVEVLRDPGCHVASWNLSRRKIEIAADGRILVNGDHTLKFYNFANPYGDAALLTERYAGRRLAAYELNAHYRRELAKASASLAAAQDWGYGRFDDGSPIAAATRRLYRTDPELSARFADPFAAGPDSYLAYLQANRPDLL